MITDVTNINKSCKVVWFLNMSSGKIEVQGYVDLGRTPGLLGFNLN